MKLKDYIIPTLALLCIISLLFIGAIPQNLNYHDFADDRMIFGIPNFWNVITNLPFAFVGIYGLMVVRNSNERQVKQICFTLFTAFVLLTFGSSFYHESPDNRTLVLDRIPMVIIFMSFFALIIYDRIGNKIGYKTFIFLNVIGIITVLYWYLSERTGNGDLRWYGMVQFFPIIAIPLILFLYKSPFNHSKEVIPIFIFFGLAKLAETFDNEIFHMLNNMISGHSIKHLLMVAAEYYILVLLRRRLQNIA